MRAWRGDKAAVDALQQIITNSANLIRVYEIERDANCQPDVNRTRHVAQSLALVSIRLSASGS